MTRLGSVEEVQEVLTAAEMKWNELGWMCQNQTYSKTIVMELCPQRNFQFRDISQV